MRKERPEIPGIINNNTLPLEKFQNETLRPIIKMQHNLLVMLFEEYQTKRKVNFNNLSKEKRKDFITQNLKRDLKFKNLIVGCVIGNFKEDELNFYLSQSSELQKRITNIIIERFISVYIK